MSQPVPGRPEPEPGAGEAVRTRPTPPPRPPYYAVVFTSLRTPGDDGYADRSQDMERLARDVPGFLGIDSVRDADGLGITVSYWRDEQSIAAWRDHPAHSVTRADGRARWYEDFTVHVAKVERSYDFHR